ncbi:hypothetical protein V5O48_006286 [Marasmius crinis-equi]|uniref:DUF6534 domain-containing protein n=1 Tax=Marasmius crinis-equi TaxID=585013 RepID=A0ABR3FKE9_9AGAR
MGLYDASLGGLLGGTWANSYVYTLELLELYKYFTTYPNDPIWLKLVVILEALVDTLSTIGNYACVYMYTVSHWGETGYLLNQYWPIPVYLSTTGASAFIVQTFLVQRYWYLTHNPTITIILALMVLAAFGGALATAIIIIKSPTYHDRHFVQVPVTVWLVSSAIADVTIAASLVVQLHRVKTAFANTQSLIKRLSGLAIQTGSATSVIALIALIIYLQNNESNISVGVAFTLGRMYALTMLRNLNTRTVAGMSDPASKANRNAPSEEPGISLNETFGGIHVHRTAMVHMDDRTSEMQKTPGTHDSRSDIVHDTGSDIKEQPFGDA